MSNKNTRYLCSMRFTANSSTDTKIDKTGVDLKAGMNMIRYKCKRFEKHLPIRG